VAAERISQKVGSRTLSLSNLDKVLWPRDGYTKGDLIRYYEAVAPWMIPHLKGRPLTLERYPNGIDAPSFFEKQIPKGAPDWVDRVSIANADARRAQIDYAVCDDAPSLVYFANLAAMILHVWTSRADSLDEPDFVLFDLDPGEECTLKTLADVALGVRDLLLGVGLPSLIKTTGGYGVHLVVPLSAGYSYDTVKLFAEIVAHRTEQELGQKVTLARTIAKRSQKAVYFDYVQVGRGKTIVAPYSVRARDLAPVSMPLHWAEMEAYARKRGSTSAYKEFSAFNIRTAIARLEKEGDLWSGKAWKKSKLEPALLKAQKIWS
jgi:bifunctional non-homologous end joining protein LigD